MGDQCAHDGAIEEKIRVASRYKLHAASLILKNSNNNYEKF